MEARVLEYPPILWFYKHSVETALFGAEKMVMVRATARALDRPGSLSLAQPRVGEHPVNIDMVTRRSQGLCARLCGVPPAEVHNTVSAQFPTVLEEVIDSGETTWLHRCLHP